MSKLAAALAFLLLTVPAAAEPVQKSNDFRTIAPRDWTLLPPGKSNGRRFVSPNREAWLSLYSTDVSDSVAGHLEKWGVEPGDRVTYQNGGKEWRVISGYTSDNRIFYRRTTLACGGRKWHDLEFEYPATEKRAMDGFVTRASYALAAYRRIGCAPSTK